MGVGTERTPHEATEVGELRVDQVTAVVERATMLLSIPSLSSRCSKHSHESEKHASRSAPRGGGEVMMDTSGEAYA